MRFEARDIKPHSERVKVSDLVEGDVYFSVTHVDCEKLIPVLEPYVFAGRDLALGDSGRRYFQNLDPVRQEHGESFTRGNYEQFYVESEEESHFFEYEQALEELMLCALRRQEKLGDSQEDAISAWQSPRFDVRELQPFSKPMPNADLKEGSILFSVFFVDEDFFIPGLEPYVFVGRDIDAEEPGLYFQDIFSYRRGVHYDATNEGQVAIFVVDSDDNLHYFEYEQALEQLMVCSLRRRA
jgi:hypothetical protein